MVKSTLGRLGNILTSSINDALDRLEDPEKQVRQLVRDMETAVDDAVSSVGAAIADERRLARRCEEEERRVTRLGEMARQALASGDESTARSFTERRLLSEGAAADAAAALADSRDTAAQLKSQLAQMRLNAQRARDRQGSLIARLRAAKSMPGWTSDPAGQLDPDAEFQRLELRLERYQEELERLRSGLEIREETAAALQGGERTGDEAAFEGQVAALELKRRIDEEIELLRNKAGG